MHLSQGTQVALSNIHTSRCGKGMTTLRALNVSRIALLISLTAAT